MHQLQRATDAPECFSYRKDANVIGITSVLHFLLPCLIFLLTVSVSLIDLREDKHYLADHPGLVPVTTAQVCGPVTFLVSISDYYFGP